MVTFVEPLEQVITPRRPSHCKQKIGDEAVNLTWRWDAVQDDQKSLVCLDEKCEVLSGERPPCSPCVRSKLPRVHVQKRRRVYRHQANMLKHMCACCWHPRGRFECSHADVLNGHTGVTHRDTHRHRHTHRHTQKYTQTQTTTHTQDTHGHTHWKHTTRRTQTG